MAASDWAATGWATAAFTGTACKRGAAGATEAATGWGKA
jgi:hypothetical protein